MIAQGMIQEYKDKQQIQLFYNYQKEKQNIDQSQPNPWRTNKGWMHYSCGFASDLYFENGTFQQLEKTVQTKMIGALCYICQQREGLVVRCSYRGCSQSFHGECGR